MAGFKLLIGTLLFMSYPTFAYKFQGFGRDIDFYIKETAQYYHISEKMLRGLVKMEDGWSDKISPTGATGVGQFTVGTWNWLAQTPEGKEIGMQLITSNNRGSRYDPRKNKRINTFATGLLAKWHIKQFMLRGIKLTDENLYLAHNIGLDGLHRAIQGRSTTEDIKNMKRNGMKSWMTVSDFITYQKNRYLTHKQLANSLAFSDPNVYSSTQLKWITPNNKNIIWINPIYR